MEHFKPLCSVPGAPCIYSLHLDIAHPFSQLGGGGERGGARRAGERSGGGGGRGRGEGGGGGGGGSDGRSWRSLVQLPLFFLITYHVHFVT